MRRSLTAGLILALVVSNGFWLYAAIDSGISAAHRESELGRTRSALQQALAVLPTAANPESTREEVIAAAAASAPEAEAFEKDGYLWVGRLGLRFGPSGRLVAVRPSWSPL